MKRYNHKGETNTNKMQVQPPTNVHCHQYHQPTNKHYHQFQSQTTATKNLPSKNKEYEILTNFEEDVKKSNWKIEFVAALKKFTKKNIVL